METIKAGKYKDIASPHRQMEKEERQMLQRLIDDTHEQFILDVSRARSMNIDTLRTIADGSVFTGRQAVKLGLIDTLGTYEEALAYLRARLNVSDKAKVIEKHKKSGLFRDMLVEEMFDKLPFLGAFRQPAGPYFLLDNL